MNAEFNNSKRTIAKNYIYNLLYQIFSLITPFITAPYVSRVLGSAGVGSYSFSFTIANYFVLLGSLGFMYYAQREIAALQDERKKQSITFWEIIIARFISVGVAVIFYLVLIISNIFYDYNSLLLLFVITVIGTAFDVTFLFQGNDNFGIIAIRNIIIRTIGIILIFIFVKNENDLWVYTLLQCVIGIVSNISLWTRIKKHIDYIPVKELKPSRHFVPTLKLFIPTIAMSVYTMLDRTLIGLMIPGSKEVLTNSGTLVVKKIADIENGYYEQSEKIVKMAMTVFTSLSTVLVSRNSNDLATGNIKSFEQNIYGAIKFLFLIGMPIMCGLSAVAQNFTPWFFGGGYEKVPYLIMIFSPITMIIGLSNILGRQYLIPKKRDNAFTIAICCGAVTNFLLNLLLIPLFQSYGAAVASVIAEIVVTLVMYLQSRKEIHINKPIISCWKEVIASIIMFIVVYFTQTVMRPSVMNTFILIFEGASLYVLILLMLKDKMFMNVMSLAINTIKRRNEND